MLNPVKLQEELTTTFSEVLQPAIEYLLLQSYGSSSTIGMEKAASVSQNIALLIAPALGERIAYAIDAYIHNISIYGNIITTGSPITLEAVISSLNMPSANGVVPNSLGIS